MADTQDLIVKLTMENGQFNAAVVKSDKALKKTEKSTSKLKKGFTALKVAGLAIAAILTGKLIKGLAGFVKKAGEFEQLNVAFKTFLGSAKEARKVIAELEKFSIVTPFTVDQVNKAGKALLAFGFGADELTEQLTRIGNVSAGTGKDFNELATIIGKIKTQNQVFAEDLNQLTEAGIPILGELAEQFGVTEGQVKKLGSEGKITFANIDEAFKGLTETGGRFSGLIEEQSKTFLGRFSTLQGNLSILARTIGQKLLPVVGPIVDKLNEFVSSANKFGAVDEAIFRTTNAFGALFAVTKVIGVALKENVIDPLAGVGKTALGVLKILNPFTGGKEIREGLDDIKNAFNGAFDQKGVIDETTNLLIKLKNVINGVTKETKKQGEVSDETTAKGLENAEKLTAAQRAQVDAFLIQETSKIDKQIAEGERLLQFKKLTEEEEKAIEQRLADFKKEKRDQETQETIKQTQKRLSTLSQFANQSQALAQGTSDLVNNLIDATTKNEEEAEQKKRDARRATAVFEKLSSIFSIGVNTARAIVGFLADPGGAAGIALSALAGTTGAVNAAAVAAKPIPGFEDGGIISGLNGNGPGNEDGIIAAQNGEAVLNRQATAILGSDAINALNSGRSIQPNVNITVNTNNGQEVVNTLNDYFKGFGGSRQLGIG